MSFFPKLGRISATLTIGPCGHEHPIYPFPIMDGVTLLGFFEETAFD